MTKMKTSYGQIIKFFGLGVIFGIAILYSGLRIIYKGKIFPGSVVGQVKLSGLTMTQAEASLAMAVKTNKLHLQMNGYEWEVPPEFLGYDLEETVRAAYRHGRKLSVDQVAMMAINKEQIYPAKVTIDVSQLDKWLDTIAQQVEVTPIPTTTEIKKGKIEIKNGTDGTLINREEVIANITTKAQLLDTTPSEVVVRPVNKRLSDQGLENLKERATSLLPTTLTIEIDEAKTDLNGEKLISFLSTDPQPKTVWDEDKVRAYVESLAATYNRESENAKLEVEAGKVKEFAPGRDGISVQIAETKGVVINALEQMRQGEKKLKVEAVIMHKPPTIATGDVNRLGIEKRIGRGESYYAHSIPGRIHNVGLTASRINGALVAPGEEFSFDKTVGEISGATGYAPAYIIQNGRTELGDGGGVCQVSTTVFRAAMAAGLPIIERWAHAYRVGYYEQNSEPGIDATVFSPSKDFRFRNDTSGYILVQTINDPKTLHLIVDIYGTEDGRIATVSKPKVWGITPPPPDLYQDDPTMKVGATKQVDWAAWGAKTTFDYKVTRNGETIFEKSFPSTYKAWQNVYLRGTKTE